MYDEGIIEKVKRNKTKTKTWFWEVKLTKYGYKMRKIPKK